MLVDSSYSAIADLAGKVFVVQPRPLASGFDRELWSNFLESGLDQALCTGEPTALAEATLALQTAGRAAAQIPVAEVTVSRWLAKICEWDDGPAISSVLTSKDDWRSAPWGRVASVIYCVHGGAIARHHAPFDIVAEKTNVAGEPRDAIRLPAGDPELSSGRMTDLELLARMALLKAAMMAGAMDEACRIAIEHARQRVQFERPIAQFQAVQQMIADMAAHTAAATAAVDFAASDGSVLAAAVAKARASEAAAVVTDAAHQITGAMGFTAEFPLHRLTRRLWAWRSENGDERFWNRMIGDAAVLNGRVGLWPFLTSSDAFARASERLLTGDAR
jgi:acyl-CoA dehydrogenase